MIQLIDKEPKFIIHDAVWFNDQVARIEDIVGVSQDDEIMYMIQTSNHRYHYVCEKDLEVYIG